MPKHIWVDADACPNIIKDILFKAAIRTRTHMTLVANQIVRLFPSPFITQKKVGAGFDVADDEIVACLNPGDLVVTADIPLADAVITKGGHALNPRGEMYNANNIKQRLAFRDISESLRSAGKMTNGPAPLSKSDVQAFANQLDQFLRKK